MSDNYTELKDKEDTVITLNESNSRSKEEQHKVLKDGDFEKVLIACK